MSVEVSKSYFFGKVVLGLRHRIRLLTGTTTEDFADCVIKELNHLFLVILKIKGKGPQQYFCEHVQNHSSLTM